MATFAITFRVEHDATYSNRYNSIVEKIEAEAIGSTWNETTSFYLISSLKSADQIASSIFLNSLMSSTKDTLVVINTENNTYATRGDVKYPHTLDGFFSSKGIGFDNALRGAGLF